MSTHIKSMTELEWKQSHHKKHNQLRPRLVASVFLTHITSNVAAHAWSTKYRLITCMLAQIKSNLRDEFIKPN
jgi:hypothetical protein